VRLQEEAVPVQAGLEQAGDLLRILARHDGHTQHQQVGAQQQIAAQRRVPGADGQVALCRHLRAVRVVIAGEEHARRARPRIQPFLEAVGADVAVEDHHLGVWTALLEGQRVLEGHRAADAAAEAFRRPDTLDHHDRSRQIAARRQPCLELLLGEDARVAAIAVVRPAIFLRAGGQDGRAVLHDAAPPVRVLDRGGEIAAKAAGRHNLTAQMQRDQRVGAHPSDQGM